jgi:hypothetical protein
MCTPKLGAKQGCLLSALLPSIVLAVLGKATRQGKEIKGVLSIKKELKLSLFSDNIYNPQKYY